MKKCLTKNLIAFLLLMLLPVSISADTIGIFYNQTVEQIKFAASDLKIALESRNHNVELHPLSMLKANYANKKIVIALEDDKLALDILKFEGASLPSHLGEQAYAIRTTEKSKKTYWVIAGDVNGAMYGGLEMAENINFEGFKKKYNSHEEPAVMKRGVKLNLPFDEKSPTYERNSKGTSYQKAIPHIWDITFWQEWFDEMARHRYNMVSVWNNHPFTSLIVLSEYPDLAIQDVTGFDGYTKKMSIQEKIDFWREVMKLAHARGFEFLFFNWNVWVSNANGKYGLADRETSDANKEYMYKSMMKLLETYPDLDGFGVTNGENKSNDEFLWEAYGKAVRDYSIKNPERKILFIHRWHQANLESIKSIFSDLFVQPNVTFEMSYKYSKAHMYSTPVPKHFTRFKELIKNDMKTWFTVRNDDFYYHTWGDPNYARTYIKGMMDYQPYFAGFYVGCDGFCPTRNFLSKNTSFEGRLETQRQWYMSMIWGRLAYNPQTSDDLFKKHMGHRYPEVSADKLFDAWRKSSSCLQRTNDLLHEDFDLDFKWYPEACLWYRGFVTVDLFAAADVGPGSEYCNIKNTALNLCDGKKGSLELADEMEADAMSALEQVSKMKAKPNTELWEAIHNIKAISYLSMYYVHKIRAATYKLSDKPSEVTSSLGKGYCWWMSYTTLMNSMYHGQSNQRIRPVLPDWHFQDDEVLKEFHNHGGIGVPTFNEYNITIP